MFRLTVCSDKFQNYYLYKTFVYYSSISKQSKYDHKTKINPYKNRFSEMREIEDVCFDKTNPEINLFTIYLQTNTTYRQKLTLNIDPLPQTI